LLALLLNIFKDPSNLNWPWSTNYPSLGEVFSHFSTFLTWSSQTFHKFFTTADGSLTNKRLWNRSNNTFLAILVPPLPLTFWMRKVVQELLQQIKCFRNCDYYNNSNLRFEFSDNISLYFETITNCIWTVTRKKEKSIKMLP